MKPCFRKAITILTPVLLLVSSVLLSLLGAEIAYRLSLYNGMQNNPTYVAASDSIYQYDHELGYTHVPNMKIVEAKVTQGYPVLWNERFTDASGNMTRLRHADGKRRYRILVLGDSFTAYQREGSTWPDLLQEKLDAQLPGRFQVVNCGRNMYGILQMFDLAEVKVKELRPDLVIVAFITDDLRRRRFWMTVESSEGAKRAIKRMAPLEEGGAEPSLDSFLVYPAMTRSWCESMTTSTKPEDPLLAAMNDRYRRIVMEERYRDVFLSCTTSFLFNRIVYGDAFHGVLSRLREPSLAEEAYRKDNRFQNRVASLNASRVPYLLVHLPTYRDLRNGKFMITDVESEILQSLASMTGKKIINLLDYVPGFRDPIEGLYLLPHDGHPSRRGLEFLADSVLNLLLRDVLERAGSGRGWAAKLDRPYNRASASVKGSEPSHKENG